MGSLLLVAASMLLMCGCGCGRSDGLQRAAASGKIALDGIEIAEGTIAFYPTDGLQGPAAGGAIQGGRYSIAGSRGPVVGRNRVEIHATRKTGRKVQAPISDPGVMTDEVVEALPDRYHSKSILTCEVKPGSNRLNFELTTQ